MRESDVAQAPQERSIVGRVIDATQSPQVVSRGKFFRVFAEVVKIVPPDPKALGPKS